MPTIKHTDPRCKSRMSMRGYCIVCNAARANNTTDQHLATIATVSATIDAGGKPRTPRRAATKTVTAVPGYFPAEHRARIAFWDDERGLGNALIVTLATGWCWAEEQGAHVQGFDTVEAVRLALRKTVPCRCASCRQDANNAPQQMPVDERPIEAPMPKARKPRIRIAVIDGEWYASPGNNSRETRSALVPAIAFCDRLNDSQGRGKTAKQRHAARAWASSKEQPGC